ncbi:hypothetical protein ABEB36_000730 [Hypothenemus hampei]|uniref:FAD synthase n=1 Tax=Hypothenemus hampei TaxID=57062 RepID=A0ABD1FEW6_HYPHA
MKLEAAAVLVPNNQCLQGELDLTVFLKKINSCLKATGIQKSKISVVEENVKSVAFELNLLSKLYDIVIIIQNPGTKYMSEALAYISSQELVHLDDLEDSNGQSLWPISTKLLKANSIPPIIYLQRMFILDSNSLEHQLNYILKDHLAHYNTKISYSKLFYVNLKESKKYLDIIQNDHITITLEETHSTTKDNELGILQLTAKDFESIVIGEKLLRHVLDSNIFSSKRIDYMSDLIYSSNDIHIRNAIMIIEKCFEEYGIDNVFLSFNGGKDCTVLLHLIQTVLCKKYKNDGAKIKLFCLYVSSDNVFKEQDDFIEQCRLFYNLEIMSTTGSIKDALRITINQKPYLKACFMGSRRTDPFCSHLTPFQKTDADWPQIMRCSPFLDWHYTDIWDYLLYYKVPYCKLYDCGFTSLGSATNTIRNPNLLFLDNDADSYLPAYKMLNEKNERSGRNISKM